VATNNVAEYSGLVAGLKAAADLGAVEVEVRMDSKLVVEQMSGRWQIKHPGCGRWRPRRPGCRRGSTPCATRGCRGRRTGGPTRWPTRPWTAAPTRHRAREAPRPGREGGPGPVRPSWTPPADGTGTRLVLVGQGETEFTRSGRYSGRHDVLLSERGEAQAAATAARVATVVGGSDAAVVSSPLSRCRATADAIAGGGRRQRDDRGRPHRVRLRRVGRSDLHRGAARLARAARRLARVVERGPARGRVHRGGRRAGRRRRWSGCSPGTRAAPWWS
jgi:probable phosphoglycerate mutase